MFESTRQHSSVELVELHQLDQVGEFGGAVVKAEEDLAILFTLEVSEENAGAAHGTETRVKNVFTYRFALSD